MAKKKENCEMPFYVVASVLEMIRSYDSYRKAGKALGVSPSYLFKVDKKKSPVSLRLAKAAGWVKRITWEKRNGKKAG